MEKIELGALDPALETDGEKLHRMGRLGLAAIPVAGGVLVEVFNSVFESPLSKRRTEVILQLAEVINELIEKKVVTEQDLQENEVFISTVAQACGIALRNHESEKLEALRSAVRNAAIAGAETGDYTPMFLGFIDSCTKAHIQLLHVLHDPEEWFCARGLKYPIVDSHGSISTICERSINGFMAEKDFYENVWSDLYRRGYVFNNGLDDSLDKEVVLRKLVTPLGLRLIRFLS